MCMLSAVGLGAVAVAVEVAVSIALVNVFTIAAARVMRKWAVNESFNSGFKS